MDFLINRTTILDVILNKNKSIMRNIDELGKLLISIMEKCEITPYDHYIAKLNNEVMFDDVFAKVIGNNTTFLLKCLTGESGRGQHMCLDNELVYAYITYDDFPEAYRGVEEEYMIDFGNILLDNGFKEITEDLKYIEDSVNIKNGRSFIYTANEIGRVFAPLFDAIVQDNINLKTAEKQKEEEEKDMNPDHFNEDPEVGYKYYVSYTYSKPHGVGSLIANQLIKIATGPINSIEAINALAEYIESTITNVEKGSVAILAFSYMGIERYDREQENNTDNKNEEESSEMRTFEINYSTNLTDYSEIETIVIPTTTNIDLTQCTTTDLCKIVADYKNIQSGVDIIISSVEEITVAKGELPFVLTAEGEDDIVVHED